MGVCLYQAATVNLRTPFLISGNQWNNFQTLPSFPALAPQPSSDGSLQGFIPRNRRNPPFRKGGNLYSQRRIYSSKGHVLDKNSLCFLPVFYHKVNFIKASEKLRRTLLPFSFKGLFVRYVKSSFCLLLDRESPKASRLG